ncbi:hypothetical protein CCP3SC15_2540004 [Gammaproteobacteria bacterium]
MESMTHHQQDLILPILAHSKAAPGNETSTINVSEFVRQTGETMEHYVDTIIRISMYSIKIADRVDD